MSTTIAPPELEPEHTDASEPSHPDLLPEHEEPPGADEVDVVTPAALGFAVVSGALSSAGAAWMIGGIFRGPGARLVGMLGVLLGTSFIFLGTRFRSTVLQYLVLPTSLLLGAVLMGSATGAGTSSLGNLVRDAVTSSQLLQPPIDFAPGWRLILLTLLALVSSAACIWALSLSRPRIAVALPVPLIMVAALVQPSDSAIMTGAVSVGFVLMGLSTSFAADGVGDRFDARFELRRIARSLLGGLLLVGLLVAASQVSFLFPEQDDSRVVPPQRPPASPPQPDVPLYSVEGHLQGPLRVGVVDVYDIDEQAWMLPPVDNRRLERVELPTDLSDRFVDDSGQLSLTVTVQQASDHLLPMPANTWRVEGAITADYDPRTQSLALVGRPVFTGLTYELSSAPAPSGQELSDVVLDVPRDLEPFLEAPPMPTAVFDLLAEAPEATYPRLQTLRAALYESFIAAGEGQPTDVSADRVVELLEGGTGNPYELTAAEALLARWAGIPSRLGFGYYDAELADGGEAEFRPASAATYLEVWMGEYGWVPIVGTPPQAQQSLNDNQRNSDPNIQSSPELGINVFLPVIAGNTLPLYEYVRWYLVRLLGVGVVVGGLILAYPVLLKRIRRRRRRRWAREHGPAGRVAVAYCTVRDHMVDLALPGGGLTPLEMVELVEEDEEHAELAWLVTRGLWGDLRHRLGDQDADMAERLAASVGERLRAAQPETARVLARLSRASLRAPYSREIPNVWFELRLPRLPRPSLDALAHRTRSMLRRLRAAAAPTALLLVTALVLAACSPDSEATVEVDVAFPTRLAPDQVAGMIVRDEPEAEEAYLEGARDEDVIVDRGKVLSFTRSGLVQAALQVAELKPGYVTTDAKVSSAIADSVGSVDELDPQSEHELFVLRDGTQRLYLWFPTQKTMALLVVRTQVPEGAAEALARALIDYGDGGQINHDALSAAFATLEETTR